MNALKTASTMARMTTNQSVSRKRMLLKKAEERLPMELKRRIPITQAGAGGIRRRVWSQ